jgi:hypothetical protein
VWGPPQYGRYIPATLARVDLTTGTLLDRVTYAPDTASHLGPRDADPAVVMPAGVVGGYVYLRVLDTWYRYDADVPAADAHPARLDGVDDIVAWFDDGTLLLVAHGTLAIARAFPERLELHAIGAAPTHSPAAARADGTRYVVAGDTLYAVASAAGDAGAARVRALGSAHCEGSTFPFVWGSHVSVRCAEPSRGRERLLTFDDAAPLAHVSPPPRPVAATPQPYAIRLRSFAVPPAGQEAWNRQWWLGSPARIPGGGIAFAMHRGGGRMPAASGVPHPRERCASST